MPDSTTPPADPAPATPAAPAARGYYQKAQLEDLALGESILAAARENAIALDEQDITALYLSLLNTRRASIQHAADAVWPHSQETNRPIRKTFGLPLTRAMGM